MSARTIRHEYAKQRREGWRACDALRHARVKTQFDSLDGERVKLQWVPDECGYDDSYLECQDLKPGHVESARKALWQTIEREGVWGLVSYVRCDSCDEWREVDSCWGFVGQDGAGYEYDLMANALDALVDGE